MKKIETNACKKASTLESVRKLNILTGTKNMSVAEFEQAQARMIKKLEQDYQRFVFR